MNKLSKASKVFLFALSLFGINVSTAYAVEYEIGVRLGASYTDNVYLDVSPDEVDDFIYRASPWFSLSQSSPNFDANLRYLLDWYDYDDVNASRSYHMGEGSLTGKFFDEILFLQIGASQQQAIRDQDDDIPFGRLPLSGNLVDRRQVFAEPRLETRLGKSVSLNAGYRYTEGSYDDALVQDDTSHRATLTLENYAAGSGMTWALRYEGRNTEYDLAPEWEYRKASAELGFWVNEKVRVFGSGGRESPWDDRFNPDLEDTFWEAGLAYTGGSKVSAEFAAGERSFGSSWRGNIDYTFARGNTSASYNQSPSTTGYNRSRPGRRGILDPDEIDEFLDEPGRAERYLAKRFTWDLNLEFRRTVFTLALFDEDREGRIRADGTPLGDQAQRGVRMSAGWTPGARTQFVLSGSLIERENEASGDTEYGRVGLGVNYSLGQRTQLSLDYAYIEQQPVSSNPGGRDYKSNVVSLFVTFSM